MSKQQDQNQVNLSELDEKLALLKSLNGIDANLIKGLSEGTYQIVEIPSQQSNPQEQENLQRSLQGQPADVKPFLDNLFRSMEERFQVLETGFNNLSKSLAAMQKDTQNQFLGLAQVQAERYEAEAGALGALYKSMEGVVEHLHTIASQPVTTPAAQVTNQPPMQQYYPQQQPAAPVQYQQQPVAPQQQQPVAPQQPLQRSMAEQALNVSTQPTSQGWDPDFRQTQDEVFHKQGGNAMDLSGSTAAPLQRGLQQQQAPMPQQPQQQAPVVQYHPNNPGPQAVQFSPNQILKSMQALVGGGVVEHQDIIDYDMAAGRIHETGMQPPMRPHVAQAVFAHLSTQYAQ